METITITFSRSELLKHTITYTYNKIISIADKTKANESHIDNEQYDWFNIAVDKADAKVKRTIAHIIDNNAMICRLKEKINHNESKLSYVMDELTYEIKISHHLQLHTISDAIEDVLISDIYRQWILLNRIEKIETFEAEYNETISKLKSISLMIECRIVRPYSIN